MQEALCFLCGCIRGAFAYAAAYARVRGGVPHQRLLHVVALQSGNESDSDGSIGDLPALPAGLMASRRGSIDGVAPAVPQPTGELIDLGRGTSYADFFQRRHATAPHDGAGDSVGAGSVDSVDSVLDALHRSSAAFVVNAGAAVEHRSRSVESLDDLVGDGDHTPELRPSSSDPLHGQRLAQPRPSLPFGTGGNRDTLGPTPEVSTADSALRAFQMDVGAPYEPSKPRWPQDRSASTTPAPDLAWTGHGGRQVHVVRGGEEVEVLF